jgi:hypothetical protein
MTDPGRPTLDKSDYRERVPNYCVEFAPSEVEGRSGRDDGRRYVR